ncbi:MAG TPA: NAD(P)/FAD-dependent oxidoreductase [Polyangiaceae bacterium]|nr:NAD(P)/FAD-dependent oxidoreductase [Polyangiaceae bacterium]
MDATYDDLVIGTGMAGLTVGALLAHAGRRVLLVEAHEYPGGYAHSFPMGKYRFCAQVHYVFGCGEGEPVHRFLETIGADVRFRRLDPEGFDHIVIDRERYRIPTGFSKFRDRLIHRFPTAARPLRRYFDVLSAIREEIGRLPEHPSLTDLATAPFRFRHLLRYRNWTLQRLYDELEMPPRLQAVLAGQSGDYLLPPERVSLLLHVSLVSSYDSGAYYPENHFSQFVDAIVGRILSHPGCQILYSNEISRIVVERGRVDRVETTTGNIHRARCYISNLDPAKTVALAGAEQFPSDYTRKVRYEYSCSTFTMYLGVRNCDLRDHGFGSFNVWRYPHDDINRIYRDQLGRHDLSNPWLFLATPTLHTDAPGIAPPGHQILEVATSSDYAHFEEARARGRRAYNDEKTKVRNTILDILEAEFVPGLRKNLAMRVVGTPLTNEHFCWAPRGNSYGAALTPENTRWPRVDFETPIENLFLVNATAGYPSVGATVASGMRLFERLGRSAS